jgi:hypothetical protein
MQQIVVFLLKVELAGKVSDGGKSVSGQSNLGVCRMLLERKSCVQERRTMNRYLRLGIAGRSLKSKSYPQGRVRGCKSKS